MNLEYRQKILEQFDNDIVSELLEFGEKLSRLKSDVFVLMSRKFCCLYKLLLSIGITPILKEKLVVSDKLLDANTDYFREKSVTIVDDIIICGSTIKKAKDKLLGKLGAADVKVYAICADKEYLVKELVEPDYPITVLPDNKALTFCSSIVRSLSISPIPYSIEYPIFEDIKVTREEWNLFSCLGIWNVKDITSKIQEENNIAVFTAFPSSVILRKMLKIFGEKAYNLFDIIKIRIYAKLKDNQITFSMMPMITIKPLCKIHLDTIFDLIIENLILLGCSKETLSNFNEEFIKAESKLRFIQYTASLSLYLFFKHSIKKTLGREILFEFKELDIELLFGLKNVKPIKEMVDCFFVNNQDNFNNIKKFFINFKKLNDITPAEPDNGELNFLLKNAPIFSEVRDVLADFKDIFLKYYYERELPTRKKIKEKAKIDVDEAIKNSGRLEKGIAWSQILQYFKCIVKGNLNKEFEMLLSLILDYSIDRGICVPIIQYDEEKNIIYRSYRHGEDVLFAEQQLALCKLVIQSAQKAMGKDKFSKTFLEKLMVLFIKVGINKNIFEKQYGINGQESFARIDFHLHGAVVKYYDKKTRDTNRDIWLHEYLIEKNVIKEKDEEYSVVDNHDDKIFQTIQNPNSAREAVHFGNLIGRLHEGFVSEGKKVNLTLDDLMYITTCDTPKNVSKALRAEINIYLKQYNTIFRFIEKGITQKDKLGKNIGFKALNNLHKKTNAWVKNKADNVIEEWHKILETEEKTLEMSDWDAYCAAIGTGCTPSERERFNKHIISFSNTGHRLLFYLDIFRAYQGSGEMKKFIGFYKNTNNLTNEINANKNFNKINEKELFSDEEKKYFNTMLEHYNDNWENLQKNKLESLIIGKLKFYTEKAKKNISVYESAIKEQEQEEYAELCDYIVDCDIIDPAVIDEQLYDYSNEIKIVNHEIDVALKDVIALKKRIYKEYNQNSKTGLVINNDPINDHNISIFFPENDELNIRYIKDYIQGLLKISDKTDKIFFRIVIYSANEFSNRIYIKKNNGISDVSEFINFQKKFKEEVKIFGIPGYGKSSGQFSKGNHGFSEKAILIVDNTHEQSIGRQMGLKFKRKDEIQIDGAEENILLETYILDE
jgi:hypothetical protein